MTCRQRFAAAMAGELVDRPPLFDEGIRDEVLAQWREQGLPHDADLASLARHDRRERVEVDFWPRPALEHPVESAAELRELRRRLDPDDPGRLPADWANRVAGLRGREHVLELYLHSGFFLTNGANTWDKVERLLYRTHDDPGLVQAVMEAHAECAAALVQRILTEVEIDYATFSEPISGPDRPLIGPAMFRRLSLATYDSILRALRRGGRRTVVFQTYANSRALLPAVVEAGFDCLWAMESTPGSMDYLELRREFGPGLRLIGGIDLDWLRLPAAEITGRMEALLPPLLAQGGYVPLADGRVRPDIPLQAYLHYRAELERLTA
jgi:hypothetical protein